jgi:hypothetical protein
LILAGKRDVTVEIVPLADEQSEPIETVVLRILDPLPLSSIPEPTAYSFDPASREAAAVIFDRVTPENGAVELALPADGDTYFPWQRIRMLAAAYHPTVDVTHVDFTSGDTLIGSSDIAFFQPNGGGLILHEFNWDQPGPGEHVITARAKLPDGTELISSPVKISVPAIPPPVVLGIVGVDPDAAEIGADSLADPAVFEIRRVDGPVDVPVTVWYTVAGSAANGVDYDRLEGTIALPAGQEKVELIVKPMPDQALEGEESVVISLEPPACITIFPPPPSCYHIADDGVAKAVIQDYGLAPGTPEIGTAVFKGVERQGDGAVRLRISTPDGRACVLETSTDLIHWDPVAPVTLSGGLLEFRDENARTNQQRFYRTRLP